jgi:hypothetical protein
MSYRVVPVCVEKCCERSKVAQPNRNKPMTASASTAANPQNTVMQGVAIMLFAMIILPGMDVIAKYMAVVEGMAPAQVTFYRFFFQLVATLPLLITVVPLVVCGRCARKGSGSTCCAAFFWRRRPCSSSFR